MLLVLLLSLNTLNCYLLAVVSSVIDPPLNVFPVLRKTTDPRLLGG